MESAVYIYVLYLLGGIVGGYIVELVIVNLLNGEPHKAAIYSASMAFAIGKYLSLAKKRSSKLRSPSYSLYPSTRALIGSLSSFALSSLLQACS